MELILIRHARPAQVENAEGPADPPLTGLGHRQARALASWLGGEALDGLYVSPLARARQTVEPLEEQLGIEAVVLDAVSEFDADSPTYIPLEVIRRDRAAWRAYLARLEATDRRAFAEQVTGGIEALIAAHRGQRVAVVCHGGVINAWASYTLGIEPRMFFNPQYTAVNRFMAATSGERSIVSLNETAHLRSSADLLAG
jgi:probable phosphoglycerate mutase